jgi:dimethylhistidine N-methyltransferase/ergothioneine biosynthesis protein EgtC
LYRQSWAPRRQRFGTVNADGFGVGWYASGDPVPARYRRAVPIWADESFADVARVTVSGAMLAAVRSASADTQFGEASVAPFAADGWLFSHNGRIEGWPAAAASVAATLPASALLAMEARVDSALLWALVLQRLRLGMVAADALRETIATLESAGVTGRFNFLLTDGQCIAASAAGDTLCYRRAAGAVVVASEPADDEPGWQDVPDGTVLTADTSGVTLSAISSVNAQHRRKDRDPVTSIDRRLPAGFLASSLRADALAGLSATPKSLPPKWFYDAQGSALFEKITELPEYYPTRAERSILGPRASSIASLTGARTLVEFGSGSSEKTRLLLSALREAGTLRCYVPVDVSEPALVMAADSLTGEYPGLDVRAVVSDFEEHLGLPAPGDAPAPRLVAFLGSTIGNLVPAQRAAFLARVRAALVPGDAFLLGTDLVKDPAVLVAAYDDASGVTAEFNKNVLAVLNAELGADFDLDAFEHVAVWDPEAEWIEMRLRSVVEQTVHVPGIGLTVLFAEGEEMRTEVSAKFRRDRVAAELAAAGLEMRSWWTDPDGQFGLSLSVPT